MNTIIKYFIYILYILFFIYLLIVSILLIKFKAYDKNKSFKENIDKINLGFIMIISMFLQYGLYGNRKSSGLSGISTANY